MPFAVHCFSSALSSNPVCRVSRALPQVVLGMTAINMMKKGFASSAATAE
jgi:hypothetical protein